MPPIDISGGGSLVQTAAATGATAQALRAPQLLDAAFREGFADITRVDFQASQPAEKQNQLQLVVAETDVPETNTYVEGDATPLRKPPAALVTQLAVDLPAPDAPEAIIRGQSQPADRVAGEATGEAARNWHWWLGVAALSPLVLWGGWQRWLVKQESKRVVS